MRTGFVSRLDCKGQANQSKSKQIKAIKTKMSSRAVKRVTIDLKNALEEEADKLYAVVIDESNIMKWDVHIKGPVGSFYEGQTYTASMEFPDDYPIKPPKMKFISSIFHPNVYADGNICISILKTVDELDVRYEDVETVDSTWTAAGNASSVILSVISLLSDPNPDSPANVDAAKLYRTAEKNDDFKKKVYQVYKTNSI